MDFHDIRFPARLSFGSAGGPERRTEIVTLANGFEERNTPWAASRRRYDAGVGVRSLDDIAVLIAFFESRRAQLYGFRWKDWLDFKSCAPSQMPAFGDQIIGSGDGVQTEFQLVKTYASGTASYTRDITKPVAGTVVLGIDGVAQTGGHSIDTTTGLVTFATAPATGVQITAGFEFDVPVRFDTDRINASAASFQAGEIPDVPVVEIRL
jgi:uncharacterized protein (TIGR02217 family)